jgi:hypothetical protein
MRTNFSQHNAIRRGFGIPFMGGAGERDNTGALADFFYD